MRKPSTRAGRLVDEVEDLALVVGLEGLELHAELTRQVGKATVDVVQGVRPVHLGLAPPQQPEIRPVDHGDLHDSARFSHSSRAEK